MENDRVRLWRADGLEGLELLEARYVRQSCPRHSHDTYGIGVVHAGSNRFRYRGGSHVAPPGSVCTVTYDEAHAGEVTEEGLVYRCLYPSPELMGRVAAELREKAEGRVYLLPPVIGDATTARMVDQLFAAELGAEPLLARQTLLYALLARVLVRHATERLEPDIHTPGERIAALARQHMRSNLTENISLERLAEAAGTRSFALLRAFKRRHGLPPHAYLTQLRVRLARDLIAQGMPLAEVAQAAGFADQSHLTRHFKRILGVTPGRYGRR